MNCFRRKTTTTNRERPMNGPKDPLDGGWGIVVVFAAFTVCLLTSMMTNCAGILYLSWQHDFDSSASQTGAIASIMSSSSYFGSALASVICNRYGCRLTWILGGVMMLLASLASFWASHLFQMYIIGAFLGIGVALCFLASNVAVAEYFKKYYAIAAGFTTAGIGTGIIVFPPLLRLLLDTYGWRGTMLITGGLSANICSVGALYRPLRREGRRCVKEYEPVGDNVATPTEDPSNDEQSPLDIVQPVAHDKKKCVSFVTSFLGLFSELRLDLLLKSYRFTLFCLICMEFNIAYSCFLVFLVPSAQDSGIDEQKAPFLLSIMGFGSLGARVASGFFVTRRTPVEGVFTFSILLCSVAALCAQGESYGSYAASACIMGVGTGAKGAIGFVLIRKILGLGNVASGMGISYLIGGVGDLLGPIIAGMLYDKTGNFSAVFYVLAGLVSAAALQMLLLPVLRRIEPGVSDEGERLAPVAV